MVTGFIVIFFLQRSQQDFNVKDYVDNLQDTVVPMINVQETRQYLGWRITIDVTATKLASKLSPIAVQIMKNTVAFRDPPILNSPKRCGNVWNSVGRRLGHV